MFNLFEEYEFTLVVVWVVAFGALLVNLLSCWLCCCCRAMDRPRQVLAAATAAIVAFALLTTAYYLVDVSQYLPLDSAHHRSIFSQVINTTAPLKRLKLLKF